jgi:glyoxylase-like metal-dependent hydrolase (beta-lactamase superfamily II)
MQLHASGTGRPIGSRAMRRVPGTIARVAAALVTAVGLVAQPPPGTNLEVLQVRPNFYMIAGAGGNIGFQVGADGVVVVDSGSASSADAVVAAIKKVTTQPIRYVINTSADPDHVGGNEAISQKPGRRCSHKRRSRYRRRFPGRRRVHPFRRTGLDENERTEREAFPFPVGAWPTETFNQPRKYMYLNGEGIEVSISRRRTRMAMRLSSFAAPTSSWPATSSTRRVSR